MKATHKLSEIGDLFFIILISLVPHRELEFITKECSIYKVERRYVTIDGHVALVVVPTEDDTGDHNLMEMWCSINLRQIGTWQCPICRDKFPEENVCGHIVYERTVVDVLPAAKHDGKDKVLVWPDGTWHRCDEAEVDATERAIHDNGWDHAILWFPEELGDEELNIEVHKLDIVAYPL